uniref:Uncharacterized protein n=1 Tax=Aegilops tauschii subsp. strangulata TaxID=200361 RepID=A0A453LS51_AEGTS
FKSLFDPNEETKGGKVLPKAYLKAAREVVRTLRESLGEGDAAGDSASFRRGADSAKTSIREFIGGWRGQPAVAREVQPASSNSIPFLLSQCSECCCSTSTKFVRKFSFT